MTFFLLGLLKKMRRKLWQGFSGKMRPNSEILQGSAEFVAYLLVNGIDHLLVGKHTQPYRESPRCKETASLTRSVALAKADRSPSDSLTYDQTTVDRHNANRSGCVAVAFGKPDWFACSRRRLSKLIPVVPDNFLMWSHYTAGHQGLVIEFNVRDDF